MIRFGPFQLLTLPDVACQYLQSRWLEAAHDNDPHKMDKWWNDSEQVLSAILIASDRYNSTLKAQRHSVFKGETPKVYI